MAVAIILAITVPFLILEITYILAPDQGVQQPPLQPQPNPKPESLLSQIVWVAQWIGLAAVIAIAFVGTFLFVDHIRKIKTTPK
jgi:ABC-type Fe3+ transport system permease subunit